MIEYRDIPGWPGYRATSEGEIQSSWRKTGCSSYEPIGQWKTLKPYSNGRGYLKVDLKISGKRLKGYVHILVALAFHGPNPGEMDVAHKDSDKSNCSPSNLEYKTHVANEQDKIRNGTWGKKITQSKAAEVLKKKPLYDSGLATQVEIARETGVSKYVVGRIFSGENWAHINEPDPTNDTVRGASKATGSVSAPEPNGSEGADASGVRELLRPHACPGVGVLDVEDSEYSIDYWQEVVNSYEAGRG